MKGETKILSHNDSDLTLVESRLREVFSANPKVVFAFLFGSTVRGEETCRSDLDLAVYVTEPDNFSFYDKLELHGDCCRVMQRSDLDLIVLNQAKNIILLDEVMREGMLIYSIDDDAVDNFQVKIIHQAIDFREHRKRSMKI